MYVHVVVLIIAELARECSGNLDTKLCSVGGLSSSLSVDSRALRSLDHRAQKQKNKKKNK